MFRVLVILFLSVIQLCFSFSEWIHLEVGSGNYGEKNLKNKRIHQTYDPNVQYKVLFWTLDQLIERYGPHGIFILNDIKPEYGKYAAKKLREYADMQEYDHLEIATIPGDYFGTNFSEYLQKYGREKVDSLHLKNPEATIFAGRKNNYESFAQVRKKGRDNLQNLANFSKSGLYFFTLYKGGFFPEIEKTEFADQGIFYHETDDWEAIDYYHPNGNKIKDGRIFHIFPESESA